MKLHYEGRVVCLKDGYKIYANWDPDIEVEDEDLDKAKEKFKQECQKHSVNVDKMDFTMTFLG